MQKRLYPGNITIPVLTVLLLFMLLTPLHAQTFAKNYTDPLTGMEFVLVPGGCFEMGNKRGRGGMEEAHYATGLRVALPAVSAVTSSP
ncbi:MAG TPA: hypothetical protein VGA63_12520 [Geopsychrobacteraceae bacterium]|jgi:hypothetical protein